MPKSVEVLVYSFAELSDKAKEKAHYDYLSDGCLFWTGENEYTIESFCKLFYIDLNNWSIDDCHYSYDATIPAQRSITKKQAVDMVNQWADKIGYRLCYDALQAIQDANNWLYGDLKYVLDQCLDAMFKSCRDDYAHQSSIEYFAELCDCNEWQFLETGEMFHE